jgi:hypothetical protein
MIMLARLSKGTRKFGETETPDFALAGAEWVNGDVALPSQAEQETWSDAAELSGSCSVNKWLEGRHPYSILRTAVVPAEFRD